jgi:PAS domain S-box-containing protein
MPEKPTYEELEKRFQELGKKLQDNKKTEAALRDREGKFLALIEAISDWIYGVDLNGVYTYASPKVKNVMGYSPKEVIGRSIIDFMPENETARTLKFFKDITEAQEPFSGFVNTHVHKDGRHISLETNGAPVFDSSGILIGYWGLGRDITNRVASEEELKRSEEKWRSLAENAPNIVLILDREGIIQFINRTAQRFNTKEAIGLNHLDYIEPEYHPIILETLEQVFQTGKPGSYIHKGEGLNGGVSWYESHIGPLESDGKVVAAIMIATDITERKEAEDALLRAHEETERQVRERTTELLQTNEALQKEIGERKRVEASLLESEQRFRSLVESTSDMVWELDLSGVYTYVSPKAKDLLGYDAEEIIGKSPFDLMSGDESKRASSFLMEVSEKQRPFSGFQTTVIHKDGRRIIVETSGVPILDSGGDIMGFRGIDRDITERIRSQEHMFQAAKMVSLGTLVSGVAHEINNPITSIMLNGPILQKIWTDTSPILDEYFKEHKDIRVAGISYSQMSERVPVLLSDIVEGTKRIKRIVDELKNFARQGPSTLTDDVDINKAVKKAVRFASNLIKKATRHFSVDYAVNLPGIKGNTQHIEQVAINLIINACEALPDNGHSIQVVTEYDHKSDSIAIKVRDQGEGMLPEVLERIGDPFFTTKRDGGGTGLGLAISTRIIKDHGGKIEFDSAPGEGTTVTVTIPASQGTGEVHLS